MRAALILGLAAAAWSCRSQPTAAADAPGMLSVRWTGRDTGGFAARATASWCPADTMLQIEAIRADTGVSLVLFDHDTVTVGQHPVLAPEAQATWRPLAAAAIRWFNGTEVLGFTGVGGVVSVTATDSGATGTVDVRLRAPNQMDTLHLTGTFTSVAIGPAVGSCGRASKGKTG